MVELGKNSSGPAQQGIDPAAVASSSKRAAILIAFVLLPIGVGLRRARGQGVSGPRVHLRGKWQLAVRATVVLVFGPALLASRIGLDVLLGGFVAAALRRAERQPVTMSG